MNLAALFFWQAGGVAGLGGFLIPLGLMFGIMYFLVILPQQRQRKKVQEMLGAVKTAIRSSPPRASTAPSMAWTATRSSENRR